MNREAYSKLSGKIKTNKEKGDGEMTTATASQGNLDIALAQLIKKNSEKIKANSPKNPSISKNDEWRNETHWDKLFEELGKK